METGNILKKIQSSHLPKPGTGGQAKFKVQNSERNKVISVLLIIAIAAIMCLLPHPPNFAPIAGLALFAGANLSKKQAIAASLSAMVISDFFLGLHDTIFFVYGSFVATVFIGSCLKSRQNATRLLGASLTSSILFFVVTNFGVWATATMYPKTVSGLMNAYLLGLPFFRNTVLGDMLYSFSFFYGYRFIETYLKNKSFVIMPKKQS